MKNLRFPPTLFIALNAVALFSNSIYVFALPLKILHQSLANSEHKLTRFVMISMPRSGTGWLWLSLNSHPCITMAGDGIFNGTFWNQSNAEHGIELFFDEEMQLRSAADGVFFESTPERYQRNYNNVKALKGPDAWIDQNATIFGRDVSSKISRNDDLNKTGDARGFIWHMKQGVFQNWPWFVEFCKEHNVKIIWLQRRHLLRQFISLHNLAINGSAHTYSEEKAESMRTNKLNISIDFLFETLHKWENENANMKSLFSNATLNGVKTLSLVYEEMAKAPQIRDDAAAFVLKGSDCKIKHNGPPKHDFVKVHAKDLKDLIANWPEVYTALNGTHFEYLLKD